MNKIDTNVLGNPDSQIMKVSGQNLKQEHTHISTAVSAAMNLQTLKPNHCLQRFAKLRLRQPSCRGPPTMDDPK